MVRKSLGFVPLIWHCPYCETQNPGPIKSCTGCGAPQPEDVEFLLVEEDKFNFIKDEALIKMAKAGPDIHCPYCGTRNPATAEVCKKCGGDISHGGKVRDTAQPVKTVAEAEEVASAPPAPLSAAPQPKKERSRSFTIFAVLGVLLFITCLVVAMILLFRTDAVDATVTNVSWERSIEIEVYTNVTREDFRDLIPASANIISCTESYRYTSEDPVFNATEVCTIEEDVEDTGTGLGERFEVCIYEVYDDYCQYNIMDWVEDETITETGDNLGPVWPDPNLKDNQQIGERNESYTITFSGDGQTYRYTTTDSALFMQAVPGSQWTLKVNRLGGVQAIQPDN